jgi:putative peptide zinc metalloprotease protein
VAGSLLSQHWYAVAALRPRLATHVLVHRRVFRGKLWYMLQDTTSGRFHRLTPGAYALVAAMDGLTTLQVIWESACKSLPDGLPSQDEVVQLLSQLHAVDLLVCELSPDIAELFQRFRRQRRDQLRRRFFDPMGMRWPLWNPDAFLERWYPHLRVLLSGYRGAVVWLLTVMPALMLAGVHWPALTENISDRILSAQNLVLLWFIFPVVKALHELGHGFATKAGGGRVHEMGLMLMVFTPVPYVDASAAYAFPSKWRRAVVGAAGILVETWLAALAMYVWVLAEPGLVRAVAFNVMVIAGVSTVIVNGNPLMRYDGYHVLADVLEMPNLASRGSRYFTYLADRYLFRALDLEAPDESGSERFWLVIYTVASTAYRIAIMVSMIWFLSKKYFFFGVLLALWAAISLLCIPLWKGWRHVTESPALHRTRDHALRVTVGTLLALVVLLTVVPMPFLTQAEGVVWLPEQQIVRARAAGFVHQVLTPSGAATSAGSPVVLLSNRTLETDLAQSHGRVDELDARLRDSMLDTPTAALVNQAQLAEAREAERQNAAKVGELLVTAGDSGQFLQVDGKALDGRYFKRGDIVGYVRKPVEQPTIRVIVSQDDIDLVRKRFAGADVRLAYDVPDIFAARLVREVPAGQDELPSKGLGQQGGGHVATDPRDPHGTKSLQRYFQLDLVIPGHAALTQWYGSRVYVRFDHGYAPLGYQWFLRLRQLFLAHLNV